MHITGRTNDIVEQCPKCKGVFVTYDEHLGGFRCLRVDCGHIVPYHIALAEYKKRKAGTREKAMLAGRGLENLA